MPVRVHVYSSSWGLSLPDSGTAHPCAPTTHPFPLQLFPPFGCGPRSIAVHPRCKKKYLLLEVHGQFSFDNHLRVLPAATREQSKVLKLGTVYLAAAFNPTPSLHIRLEGNPGFINGRLPLRSKDWHCCRPELYFQRKHNHCPAI